MKRLNWITKLWQWLRPPSGMALGGLLGIGFIGGILFWGAFNTGMEMTNREEFCIGCHEMENNVYEEYITTVHYNNRSGVRATCPDCHVPKEWTPKIIRKIQASKEVLGKITELIDTPKKFADHRLQMAQNEWARMKANDSQECRNCHNFEFMDFTEQKSVAGRMHAEASDQGKTCIDCHKGIAHKLPSDYHGNDAISQALSQEMATQAATTGHY
ncbi:cytochrome c-type protein NapC [Ferrimonas pelagia]|uniref:Cytochrome c-type protein n=1 Tax=Ferrimonas pelagia TaxID=1177826 RepID=A0ABP9FBS3_9GAMM